MVRLRGFPLQCHQRPHTRYGFTMLDGALHASARVAAGIAPPTVGHDALEPADGGVERQATTVGRVGRALVTVS
jgi:hypothetical protein